MFVIQTLQGYIRLEVNLSALAFAKILNKNYQLADTEKKTNRPEELDILNQREGDVTFRRLIGAYSQGRYHT